MENNIKNEIIEESQVVRALPNSEGSKLALSEPRKSASIACGATVFEVCVKVPAWASQVSYYPFGSISMICFDEYSLFWSYFDE